MRTTLTDDITLREVRDDDLPIFFDQQRDAAANHMAAFTVKGPSDHDAFQTRWKRLRNDDGITIRTILFAGRVAGHVALFGPVGEREVTYWIGREYWGKGIATAALSQFLRDMPDRPLYARAAKDNLASLRVLAKCGFTVAGHDRFYANARQEEIEEVILKLEASGGCGTPGRVVVVRSCSCECEWEVKAQMKQRATQKRRDPQGAAIQYRVEKTMIRRTKRTDATIELRQKYTGDIQANPATYNRAFADVLRRMADAIAEVKNAWVDPEVVVWTHVNGEITAEATLSPRS